MWERVPYVRNRRTTGRLRNWAKLREADDEHTRILWAVYVHSDLRMSEDHSMDVNHRMRKNSSSLESDSTLVVREWSFLVNHKLPENSLFQVLLHPNRSIASSGYGESSKQLLAGVSVPRMAPASTSRSTPRCHRPNLIR